jgi:hypothetical protein
MRGKNQAALERPSVGSERMAGGTPTASSSDSTAIFTLAGVIFAATIAFIGSQWVARTAFDAQMVQIGVGILSADPGKSDVAPAREWAITLVERHSGQEFSPQDRANLLHHPIQTQTQLPVIPGSIVSGAPCSAFRKNPDGSWTAVKLDVGNIHFESDTMKGTQETKLLDAFCGQG